MSAFSFLIRLSFGLFQPITASLPNKPVLSNLGHNTSIQREILYKLYRVPRTESYRILQSKVLLQFVILKLYLSTYLCFLPYLAEQARDQTTMSLNDEKMSSVPQDSGDTSMDIKNPENNDDFTLEAQDTELNLEKQTFPEGGLRAWSVVAATSCILFCTFGYANAFGYGPTLVYALLDKQTSNPKSVCCKNITLPIN